MKIIWAYIFLLTLGLGGLTLIGVGFSGVRFGVGVGKINPLSKTRSNYARSLKFGM